MSRHLKCPPVVYFYKITSLLYTDIINGVILSLSIRQRNACINLEILLPLFPKTPYSLLYRIRISCYIRITALKVLHYICTILQSILIYTFA
jgi:hypothetical protein